MLDREVARIADIDPTLSITRRISDRLPAVALLEASRTAQLLVLGAARRATIGGSTTHEVLMNPTSAVWLAR